MGCLGGNQSQSRSLLEVVFLHHAEKKIPSREQMKQCLQVSSGGREWRVPDCHYQLLIHKEAQS